MANYIDGVTIDELLALKKLLAKINNSITTHLTLNFVNSDIVKGLIYYKDKKGLIDAVTATNANSNGYDIVFSGNIKDGSGAKGIIAEVKSSIPVKINETDSSRSEFGSKQIENIEYDLDALIKGTDKKRALFEKRYDKTLELADYYRFLVLFDNPDVRGAIDNLLNSYQNKDSVEIWDPNKTPDKGKVYVVFVK